MGEHSCWATIEDQVIDKLQLMLKQKDEQIKILREALEFYADERDWISGGSRARQALAQIEVKNENG